MTVVRSLSRVTRALPIMGRAPSVCFLSPRSHVWVAPHHLPPRHRRVRPIERATLISVSCSIARRSFRDRYFLLAPLVARGRKSSSWTVRGYPDEWDDTGKIPHRRHGLRLLRDEGGHGCPPLVWDQGRERFRYVRNDDRDLLRRGRSQGRREPCVRSGVLYRTDHQDTEAFISRLRGARGSLRP